MADEQSSNDSSAARGPAGSEPSGSGPAGARPVTSGSGPGGAGPAASGSERAPGLGEQFGRTRSALLGLFAAHVDLASAEFSEIADQLKRAAALGGVALLLLFLAGMLIVIGTLLFLGEAIFGSIGWGLLDGAELLLGAAALLIFAIIDLGWGRALSAFIVALGVGLVVTGLLAVDWPYVSHHYSGMPAAVVLAVVCGVVLIGALGIVLGASFGRWPAAAGLLLGAVCGLLLGLLASAGPGLRVAAAIGVAALLLFWPIVAAVFVFRHGIDTTGLRKRFVPDQTIETTKETIEWVREQMPLGRKS
ncbi:MAG: hypothetical protein ABSG37_01735 [Candidatus Limnocylindrales bacterium]